MSNNERIGEDFGASICIAGVENQRNRQTFEHAIESTIERNGMSAGSWSMPLRMCPARTVREHFRRTFLILIMCAAKNYSRSVVKLDALLLVH